MKVALVTYGTFPVPAVKGGAVENLIEDIADQNEIYQKMDISVLSVYDSDAAETTKKYKKSDFHFVRIPAIIEIFDRIIFFIAKNILKRNNLISYRYILRRLFVISKYPKILLKENYDRILLVANSTLFLVLKNKKVKKKYKNKVIYYLHNEVRSLFGCEKELYGIRAVIGVSKFVNTALKTKYPQIDDGKFSILKNCIDTEAFQKCEESDLEKYKKKLQIDDDDFVIVFAGRIVREKGTLETIQAFKKLDNAKAKLLIVGGGFYSSDIIDPYMRSLLDAAKGYEDRIKFTGYVSYDKMPVIYGIGDIAVMPSIWEEPAGMTMVEAVVSGLPLITTDSGGIPEYIPYNCAIFLKRDNNLVNNITHEIEYLLDNPKIQKEMSMHGKILADIYNLKNFYDSFTAIMLNS